MRAFLTRGVLIAAEDRAAKVGIGADRALIASGAIEEDRHRRIAAA